MTGQLLTPSHQHHPQASMVRTHNHRGTDQARAWSLGCPHVVGSQSNGAGWLDLTSWSKWMCPRSRGWLQEGSIFSLKTNWPLPKKHLLLLLRQCDVQRRNTDFGFRFLVLTLVLLLPSCVSLGTSLSLNFLSCIVRVIIIIIQNT